LLECFEGFEIVNLEIFGPNVKVNVSEAGDDIVIDGYVSEERAITEMTKKLASLQDGKLEIVLLLTDRGIFIEGIWEVLQPQYRTEHDGKMIFKITLERK